MTSLTKVCSDCNRRLPLDDFYKNKSMKDGHANVCKIDAKLREEKRRRSKGVPIKNRNRINGDFKKCGKCGLIKPISAFYKRTDRKNSYKSNCIDCCSEISEMRRRANGVMSYKENKNCHAYLGVHIAERVLSKIFKNVVRMKFKNPGYDFICNKGYKIDVKSSTMTKRPDEAPRWQFNIKNNKIADYFLCLAFDNIDDLNPLHLWLIPGNAVNNQKYITVCENTVNGWFQWERPICEVRACCNALKSEEHGDGYINLESTSS